jgi:hypothetical protein
MDKDLRYLLHLYGEAPPPEDPSEMDSRDARVLAEMKSVLDQRPRLSPPESVIRDVLAAAGPNSNPVRERVRADRAAMPSRFLTRRLVGAGSGLLVLMMAALVVLWSFEDTDAVLDQETTAAVADSVIPEETTITDIFDAAPERAAVASRVEPAPREVPRESATYRPPVQVVSTAPSSPAVEQTLPGLAWDDSEDFRDVHRMINVVQSRGNDIDWDEPAVPLELLGHPGSSSRPGVRQAGYPSGRERP